jgi:hypothetical protein
MTWEDAERRLEVEICLDDGDTQRMIECRCIIEVAEERWDFMEWRAYKGELVAGLVADGTIAKCKHGWRPSD